MCGPALGIIGAVVSAAGSLMSGMMQAQSYKAQAKVQERQADIERQKGDFEAQRERERFRRVSGRQRASYLSSGVSLDGSPTDVIVDSAMENEIDVAAIRYGANIREDNFRSSAQISRMNAGNAMMGGVIGSLSPLIGGFKSMGGTSLKSGFA